MRTLFIILCLSILMVSKAHAKEPTAKYLLGTALVYPMTTKGEGLPIVSTQTFILSLPLGNGWGLAPEGGMATSLSKFLPAPHGQVSVSAGISEQVRLGGTAFYRYVPSWKGTPGQTHLVGGTIGPAFPFSSGITLILPLGTGYNTAAETWSVFAGVKCAFLLPL